MGGVRRLSPAVQMLRILLACTASLCARTAFALDSSLGISQYAHTAWKIRDGFSQGRIIAIAQAPDGYLWLGTELAWFG